jgi:hypothetical protein
MTLKGTGMVKKRAKTSTTSSSSEIPVVLKDVPAVLELGRHLVKELGLEDSTDTLGRWMAHHVAELMEKATRESDPELQRKAQDQAVETILRIWEKRASLPRDADPLKRYARIVELLVQLEEPPSPWPDRKRTGTETACLQLFVDLRRLLDVMLTIEGCPPHFLKADSVDAVAPFQTHSEKELVRLFRELIGKTDLIDQDDPLEALESAFSSATNPTSKIHALAEKIRTHLATLESSLVGGHDEEKRTDAELEFDVTASPYATDTEID